MLRGKDEVYVATSGMIFFNFLRESQKLILEKDLALDLTNLLVDA